MRNHSVSGMLRLVFVQAPVRSESLLLFSDLLVGKLAQRVKKLEHYGTVPF